MIGHLILALWVILAYAAIVASMVGLDALADAVAPLWARRCPARLAGRHCHRPRGHEAYWHEHGSLRWGP